ncbi:MAG: NAD-dependent epimerase/dehydratase family protein [Polyangiaceae bacterium]|nr:NAD-dependent epimerase/dehydratase family protein [Polyangiaceae bacterium]
MSERWFVAGGAGFIGSHLVDRLVDWGPGTVYDNLSVGRRERVADHVERGTVTLKVADLLDLKQLEQAMAEHEIVFHLAANPEARWGLENPRLDLEQGTIVTHNVLEAMRRTGARRLVFASSGTVYGDTAEPCGEEDLGHLPISLYGASKLASEALISAYVECFGLQAWIFRFGNVAGPRGTHGAALDFLYRLKTNPVDLEVLGDGRQAKPYVWVADVVDAILFALEHAPGPLSVLNIAPPDVTAVSRIAELCVAASPNPTATIRYRGGERGWPGDVPRSRMLGDRLAALGYRLTRTSDEAVAAAVAALAKEVFEGHAAPPSRAQRERGS